MDSNSSDLPLTSVCVHAFMRLCVYGGGLFSVTSLDTKVNAFVFNKLPVTVTVTVTSCRVTVTVTRSRVIY
jgi:hypothetical protein